MAFPTTILVVEAFFVIDGVDVDVTGDIRGIDGTRAINITWGRRDQAGKPSPTQCRFELNDPTGLYDQENALSPYYGKIGVGTAFWVRVDGTSDRFYGRVSSMVATWTEPDGSDTVVVVVASGERRRLGQQQRPLASPATRALGSADSRSTMISWWPLEEESGATVFSSPLAAPGLFRSFGAVTFGAYTNHPATTRMLTIGAGGQLILNTPEHTLTGEYKMIGVANIPLAGLTLNKVAWRLIFVGANRYVDVVYGTGGHGTLQNIVRVLSTGATTFTGAIVDFSSYVLGKDFMISLELAQNGANVDMTTLVVNQTNTSGLSSESLTGLTMTTLSYIYIGAEDVTGLSWGQWAVGNDTGGFADFISQTFGGGLGTQAFTEEDSGWRLDRLLGEEGLPFTYDGSLYDTEEAGPQERDTLLDLLDDMIELDGGIQSERRGANPPAFHYRPRESLYSQAPRLWMTMAHVSGGMRPIGDDFQTANSVTVSRPDGGSYTASYDTPDGYHSTTQDPSEHPHGIGPYPLPLTLHAFEDERLRGLAWWNAHVRAWRERRIAAVTVEMARTAVAADAHVSAVAPDIVEGDVIAIDTTGVTSRWIPPDLALLMVQGGEENISQCLWNFTWNTTPAWAWEVWTVETSGSTLAFAVDSDDTAFKLATSLGPEWLTDGRDFHIQIDGDASTVTSIANMTPAFIAAGAIANGNNASVVPALPAGITPDTDQTLWIWATIRNSGTGTVNTPTGWTTIVEFGNCKLMARYYINGVTAPTVTFSGGVANADTQARMWAMSGLSLEIGSGTKLVPAAATQLNGSAQNIALPALQVHRDGGATFYCLWKQDDWTSAATISGADAEIADNATTTGDDSAIAVDYDITNAASIAAGSATVTGGASAISRAVLVNIRPLQAATVTRNVNRVATSHAAGSAVTGWRMGVNAL